MARVVPSETNQK